MVVRTLPPNASSPKLMLVLEPIVILSSDVVEEKASLPILVTFAGVSTVFKLLHNSNARSPILLRLELEPNMTSSKLMQL
jgi:hypothetical protein